MLAPAEADLVRRDPALPGLATVLDPAAFLAVLGRAAPGPGPERAEIHYVKYKPRTYCRVKYGVQVGGVRCDVEARACLPEDFRSHLEEDAPTVPGPLGPGRLMLSDSAVVVTVFPNDPGLPQVLGLNDPARRAGLLRELVPARPELWDGMARCLRYWPGRRYSVEIRGVGGARALVKAYTRKGYRRALLNARAFESRGPLRVARLLGSSDRDRLLAFEWLPGRMLSELWLTPGFDCRTATSIGEALATLHERPATGLECWEREDEAGYVRSLGLEIGFLCPRLSALAERLARRLSDWLAGAPEVHLPVHSDFSDSQVLIDGKDVAIIDLDSACCGDPVDDVGSVLAQTVMYEIRGKVSSARGSELRSALLQGYHLSAKGSPQDRIVPYTVAAMLRRARFAFRARSPEWQEIAAESLGRALKIAMYTRTI